ncbi:transporter [Ganoderma sinense ZZ0214-1]|uniref:Transporter n=1 Tax=Ganoderma sinense ZZ0214-1 TaxID=1077348 RepID=A0A2G8SF20_9APHY|nr:transporter [Ganoderma sinense ZZ0214-1]
MPPKSSRPKKRLPNRKTATNAQNPGSHADHAHDHGNPSPHADQSISQPSVADLERVISRILLLRYEQDLARLFSTHLYHISLVHIPTLVLQCVTVGGPSWVAVNADCDDIKNFFRGAIAMDFRQAGDRIATKSVLWTYTALRHFAKSNGIPICERRGLHSWQLLPYYDALQAHLDSLEAQHRPRFVKPPLLGPPTDALNKLAEAARASKKAKDREWKARVREGYDRACSTMWRVAQEFDVRGYGLVLRQKLVEKWCKCGCSTDHLGEVCEPTVRADEEESGVRAGKEREWDGRGAGVDGWGTEEEEDLWTVDVNVNLHDAQIERDPEAADDDRMTAGELTEWRYMCSEREKEKGNLAFKKGDYAHAIKHYNDAYRIEPELPHYQLNLAAAYLKANNFVEAEHACDVALGQHSSVKGHWRRAQSRKAQGRVDDALKDLREVLRLQPANAEALAEIRALCPTEPLASDEAIASCSSSSAAFSPSGTASSSYSSWIPTPEPPAPLPFAPIETDSRKLKISFLPITVDIPAHFPEEAASAGMRMSKLPGSCSAGIAPGPTGQHTFQYAAWERYMVQRMSD